MIITFISKMASCFLVQQWKEKDTVQLYKSSLRIYEVIKAKKYRFIKKRFYEVAFNIISVNFSYILETKRLTSGL